MPGQIIQRGRNIWLVRIYHGSDVSGKRAYENKTIHGNKKDAEIFLNEALRRRDLGGTEVAAQRTMVSELLEDLLTDYRVNGKDYDWAERKVRLHVRPFFGAMQARKLTTSAVQQFIGQRQKEKAANATINRELALLKRALNLGRKHTPPKIYRLPHIPMLEENNVRKGFFEHDEYLRMKQALPEEVRALLVFAYHTGCRKAEILSLKWDQVDLSERLVRLEPGTTKNDEPRVIPVAGELYEVLEKQKRQRDAEFPECAFVFSRDGKPIRNFRKAWDQACIHAKLVDTAGNPSRIFHDLRRTGVRNLIRAGVPEKTAMAISGHKTRSVFDRYNIISEGDLKDAAAKLAAYLKSKSQSARKGPRRENPHTIRTQAVRKPV
jgi:Site-specific recombinase XerD